MDLLLWRHAHARDAMPGESDRDRPLTNKGEQQAEKMAKWLRRYMPSNTLILSSPALRTIQTVQSLRMPFQISEAICPEGSATAFVKASQWPNSQVPVLMVGHQPTLSLVVGQLLGIEQENSLPFRKGAVWWLRLKSHPSVVKPQLLTLIDPEFL